MLSSLSFANVEPWVSNTPGANSPIGEMTTWAKTFTREMGIYMDSARANYTFYCLKATSVTGSADPVRATLSQPLVVKMAKLTEWLYNKVTTASGQVYQDVLLTELVPWASTTINVTNVQLGQVHQYTNVNNSTVWMVEWISFTDGADAGSSHKIWFGMQAFSDQYSDYEIVVVPPLANLDQFFTTGANVQSLITAITQPTRDDAIQAAKNGFPETVWRSTDYDYINPLDSSHRVKTNWAVLIYGPAGNNIDAIKDALVTYILANSTHNRAQWTALFPDIFKRTEFIIAPTWYRFAVENLSLQLGGVYSPILKTGDALTLMKTIASQYDPTHVDTHTSVMGHPYRSLALAVVGSIENRNVLFDIEQVFPDYINISSQSSDFARMSTLTRNWVLMLQDLIIAAETMDESSTLPVGTMRVIRDGRLFAVKTYDNIQYLVASLKSTQDLMLS